MSECYFLRPLSESGDHLILAAMKRPAASIAKRPAVKAAGKTNAKSRAKPKAKAMAVETGRPMDEARDLLMKLSEGLPILKPVKYWTNGPFGHSQPQVLLHDDADGNTFLKRKPRQDSAGALGW